MQHNNAEVIPFNVKEVAPFSEFKNQLAKMKQENSKAVFDYADPAGNKAARSHIYKIRQVKSNLEKARKEAKQAALDYGRLVDSEAKQLTHEFEEMIAVHETPLKEIEEREEARKAAHEEKLQFLRDMADVQHDGMNRDSAAIKDLIGKVEAFKVDAKLEEFQKEAAQLKAYALSELNNYLARTVKAEEERAELERLRKEQEERERKEREERIAREAAEAAKREAEEKAQRERQEAEAKAAQEKAEQERKAKEQVEALQRAEQAQKDAEERAKRAEQEAKERAEREQRERQEAEQREAAKREANKKHKTKINNEAVADLVKAGLTEADAKSAVTAIAKGQIQHIRIAY